MNINSTEDERYEELKDKTLTIVPWNKDKEMILNNSDEKIKTAYLRFARELGINNESYKINGINELATYSNRAIVESIHQMEIQHGHLENLPKLFTVLKEVIQNSILINVETYYHEDRRESQYVKSVRHYLGGFCDENRIYPVDIAVKMYDETKQNKTNAKIYIVITVGSVSKKEVPPVRVHPQCGESVHPWATSFDISLSQFVENFNEKCGNLIKRLPDKMLSAEQKEIKKRIIHSDVEKQKKLTEIHAQIRKLKEQEKSILNSNDLTEDEEYEENDLER